MEKDKTATAMRPPKVFIVPFLLLTVPAFIVGTLYSFIKLGFLSGVAGVHRIYFAKHEAEYAERQRQRREEEAREMAEALEKHLRESGFDGDVRAVPIKKDDGEDKQQPICPVV